MTALRRMTFGRFGGIAAATALVLGAPGMAQDSETPVDVTAAPPPSAETIGPSQLRNFNLQGTVTRPADQPSATPARPADTATAVPRSGEAVSSEAAAPSNAPARVPVARQSIATGTSDSERSAGGAGTETPVTPSVPLEVTTNPAPQPSYQDPGLAIAPSDAGEDLISWPWLAALIALIGGGAFLAWNRRSRSRRYGDPGRMAFAGLVPDVDQELGPAGPRPDPVPPRTQPRTGPRADPVPREGAKPLPVPKPASDGTIAATSLKPQLTVEFQPDRVVVTDHELVLMFDLVIVNAGSAPARDLLVESRMFTAHLGQDRDIATFFQNPNGAGDRMTSLAPLGRVSLKSMARLPLDQIHQFEAGGRQLFVPLIGLNMLYRFGSNEGQASCSFLVGRGAEGDEKLAPFRVDAGPRVFRGLSSRPHSLGMQPA